MTDDQQPTDHQAEHAALHQQIDDSYKAANDYLATLTAPQLLGELRCLMGSVINTLEAAGYKHTPVGAAVYLANNAMSRFDAASPYPLPEAVTAIECRCDDDVEGGAILHRVGDLAKLLTAVREHHDAHTVELAEDLDRDTMTDTITEAITDAVRDALKAAGLNATVSDPIVINVPTDPTGPNLN